MITVEDRRANWATIKILSTMIWSLNFIAVAVLLLGTILLNVWTLGAGITVGISSWPLMVLHIKALELAFQSEGRL